MVLVEFTPSGGLFHFAVQLGRALARRGHEVELITGPEPEITSDVPGFTTTPVLPTWHPAAGTEVGPVHRRLRRVSRAVRYHAAWLVLVRELRSRHPDVVQFSGGRFPVDGLVPALLARRPVRPLLVTLAHAPVPWNEQRAGDQLYKSPPLLLRALGAGYRSVDVLAVLGERSAQDLRDHWPDLSGIEVLPHGDESVFLNGEPTSAADTDPILLFFGTLHTYKGLEVLLDAFALVRQRRPGARLTIAGAPVAAVDTTALLARAKHIGGVEVHAEYVPVDRVHALFLSARAVVTPYRYANNSGVVAMAHTFSRPVIATTVGDLPSLVADGQTGLLVPPEDPTSLADAMVRLLDDPLGAARLGDAGRAALAERASWSVVADRLAAVYDRALEARGARG